MLYEKGWNSPPHHAHAAYLRRGESIAINNATFKRAAPCLAMQQIGDFLARVGERELGCGFRQSHLSWDIVSTA